MSGAFTIPLKRAIELTGGTLEFVDGVTVMTGGNIGIQHYSLPTEVAPHKAVLNGMLIDRYLNREIGFETIDMFRLAMRRKLNEVMPYYGKLYMSEKLVFDPLSTVNLKTLATSTAEAESVATANNDSTSVNKNESRAVNSDTPQTMLAGNGDYATAAADVTSSADVTANSAETSNATNTNETEGETLTTGYQGVASELLMRYRESLMNIDLMVLQEVDELFMQVFDAPDAYTKGWIY